MKVCFETFGCRLNKAEALQMEADYLAKGWELTNTHSEADLFVVRGCSVTARAQSNCEKLIDHLRRHYPTTPIRIEGCLKSKTETLPRNRIQLTGNRKASETETPPPLPTRTARAYLKVQDGCSGNCSFCIVPSFRGKSVSIPFTELIDRASRFIDAGYHEIVITGCNLSLYASEGRKLPELLSALSDLSPNCRIRLGSIEPGSCAKACVDVIAARANCCRFLHLPIQSGSNRILQAMNRPYFLRDVEELITFACAKIPNLGLGCDIMTGFPGESELDFSASCGLLLRHPFSNAHVFPYSERPGTPAAAYVNVVPKAIRSARAHKLTELVRQTRASFARRFIGKTVGIIVESDVKCQGWTSEYLPCEAIGIAPRKALVNVIVTSYRAGKLCGRLVKEQKKSTRTCDSDASF